MEIRNVTGPEDVKLIVDIYRSDMGKFGTGHTNEDLKVIEATLTKEFNELGLNRVILIGFDGERPVGTVQLVFDHEENDPELANGSSIAHAHHLRVAYDLHKTGRGKELMNKVEQIAIDRGVSKLTLSVDDWNQNAIDFYIHRGYTEFKTKPEEKAIYMYKNLKP